VNAGVMRKPLRIEAATGEGLAGKGGVRIRLVRFGRKKVPFYRIIIAQSRSRRDGRFLEMVGHYNPMAGNDSLQRDQSTRILFLWHFGQLLVLFCPKMYRSGFFTTVQSFADVAPTAFNPLICGQNIYLSFNMCIRFHDGRIKPVWLNHHG